MRSSPGQAIGITRASIATRAGRSNRASAWPTGSSAAGVNVSESRWLATLGSPPGTRSRIQAAIVFWAHAVRGPLFGPVGQTASVAGLHGRRPKAAPYTRGPIGSGRRLRRPLTAAHGAREPSVPSGATSRAG